MTPKTARTGSKNTDPAPDYSALLDDVGDVQQGVAVVTRARNEDIAPRKLVCAHRTDWLIAVAIQSWMMKEVEVVLVIFEKR